MLSKIGTDTRENSSVFIGSGDCYKGAIQKRNQTPNKTHQLADYTRKKGVEEEAIKQVILQLLRNANGEPIKLNEILATVDSMLPIIFSHAKKQRRVQHLLKKMSEDKLIESVEKKWRPLKY